MKTSCFLLGLILLLLCLAGFIFGILSSTGGFNNTKFEFPLSDVSNIAIDNEGRIYCGLNFYSRIQVYDSNGKFIRNWYIDASQGGFVVEVDNHNDILVETYRGYMKYYFSANGKLLKTETIDTLDISRQSQVFDKLGIQYILKKSFIGTTVVRITNGIEKPMIGSPWYLWFIQFPFPSFLLGLIGGVLVWYSLFFTSTRSIVR